MNMTNKKKLYHNNYLHICILIFGYMYSLQPQDIIISIKSNQLAHITTVLETTIYSDKSRTKSTYKY